MPSEGFLQYFHDLAEIDTEARCRAAVGIRQDVERSSSAEDLQYALRRLVRGVQSSRQCCRQGFSLALSELLVAFPSSLCEVLELIRQYTELQPGLKNAELKDRLLGRLFAYAAVSQANCLKAGITGGDSSKGKRSERGALAELGKGLHEIFAMRPYLKAPAARMLADAAGELVAGGLSEKVPELLEPWTMEDKLAAMTNSGSTLDVHISGLLLELRAVYVKAEQAGTPQDKLKSWPSCLRKDFLMKSPGPEGLAQAVASDLAAAPLSDGLSWVVGPFCTWLLQASKQKDPGFQDKVWPTLHSVLFPEKASATAEAQGLRALAELASRLRDAGLDKAGGASSPDRAAALLAGLFERMPRGLSTLFKILSWQRAQAHPAALYAQRQLVDALGDPLALQQSGGKRKFHADKEASPALPMNDDMRLAILASVQSHKPFSSMNGKFQRMWQQALLAPLSAEGVRARCTTLLGNLVSAAGSPEESKKRIHADQLVQLATHSHAPDEVILSALCLLLTESYFEAAGGADKQVTLSLKKFRSAAGLDSSSAGDDLITCPLELPGNSPTEDDEKPGSAASHRTQWRLKLWSALVGLSRRMSPDQAIKLAAVAEPEAAQANADPVVKTLAFHGCLSDGSLWVMRLHEWWDFIAGAAGGEHGSPGMSPKKKRKAVSSSGSSMRCVVELESKDTALRKSCLERCRAVLAEPDSESAMPTRQRNALCGLPLVLALGLLEKDESDGEEQALLREHLQDIVAIMEELPAPPVLPDGAKARSKALSTFQEERSKVLAQVSRIAAELFVESNRLVKEAARTAWRELSEFTSDETLTSLCASIRDIEPDDEGEDKKADGSDSDDEEEEEEDEEKISATAAAKIARLQKATADLKAKRAAEAAGEGDEVVDEDDDIVIEGDAIWDQLLDDGGANEGSLLNSFASSGLQDPEAAGAKLSKWQQRLRNRQEDLTRKFREVELLELFVQKCAEKRSIIPRLLQELFDTLLVAARKAMGKDTKEGGDDQKKRTKATAMLQRMEKELTQRLASVLSKVLKHVCRGPLVLKASQWHTAAEWAEKTEALGVLAGSSQASGIGQRPAEVGAVLVYWFCSLHRARLATDKGAEPSDWKLAEKTLGGALQDWGSKKNCDKWCQALLGAFAVRQPQLLLGLPWAEHVRTSRNMFTQREQVAFVSNQLLRSLTSESEGAAEFSASFGALCAELLESTLKEVAAGEGDQATSASQRQKMRREVLRCLSVLLRTRHKRNDRQHLAPEVTCRHIAKVVAKVRDALPGRHGEVFQLCLHVLRAINGPKKEQGKGENGVRSTPNSPRMTPTSPSQTKRESPDEAGTPSSPKAGKRAKPGGGKKDGFFGAL